MDVAVGQRWRHTLFDVDRVVVGLNEGVDGEMVVTWYTDLGTDESGVRWQMRDGYFAGYYAQSLAEFVLSPEYLIV